MILVPLPTSFSTEYEQRPPYKLQDWQLRCISLALVEAWKRISKYKSDLLKSKEPLTTIDICDELAQIQADGIICGFNQESFETPDPNPQRKSAPGSKYETRSNDFILRPSGYFPGGNKRKYGLVVESKKLSQKTHGINKYVVEGMYRFINDGDYAEYMLHSMMLAYSDGYHNLPQSLCDYITNSKSKKIIKCLLAKETTKKCYSDTCEVYITNHNRLFKLPDNSDPGPIDIHHLWLVPIAS
ncbi:hypothetical protein [Desulfolutivibrio sulfoxidireducens]|uniref:hypothetical protein n=1 Tax=Desulfolutivibrio sulfoxidireducens TaxID=2773299 RepID=UPI00159E85F5|nr:hypothetical protein [Desulfolutivibrio sulfoxidireducens]QLA16482.1 hypothetical protein GD605_10300 [Desulfolutivibrio sulfoxidireducens]